MILKLVPIFILFLYIFSLLFYNSQQIILIDLPFLFLHLKHIIFDDPPLLKLLDRYLTHHRCGLFISILPFTLLINYYLLDLFLLKLIV